MHTSKYIISSLFLLCSIFFSKAQETGQKTDSIKKETYALRIGFDVSRPITQLIQQEDLGFEVTADYRLTTNWYAALELGTASEPSHEDYIKFHTKGKYMKLGFNYNTYQNVGNMRNEIFIGLRYGYSHFQQHLISITPVASQAYFDTVTLKPNTLYDNLSAHWGAFHVGLKVEVLKNVFLSSSIHFKKLISDTKPDNFANLYIPGFNSVLLNNNGIGFNYTISYAFPLLKK